MAEKENSLRSMCKEKELIVFAHPEMLANNRRHERTVFDKEELTYVYAEFSFYNKWFDEDEWTANIELNAYKTKGLDKRLCSLKKSVVVKKDQNIVYYSQGWGNKTRGQFWDEGEYYWEAKVNGVSMLKKTFHVEDRGVVTDKSNPYFTLEKIRLFESPYTLQPESQRKYYTVFDAANTRFISFELHLLCPNKADWKGEFFAYYYNDARQLKGETTVFRKVEPGSDKRVVISSGWGREELGLWYPDKYTLEILFMDRLIAVVPFEVGSQFVEGENKIQVSGFDKPSVQSIDQPVNEEDIFKELDSLIGLTEIKKKMHDYYSYLNYLRLRIAKGIEDSQKINLHSVFTGNPGTGKTTVAKMLGKIYKEIGLLSTGTLIEADRASLLGEYIGQTAPKVKKLIEQARGGVLFIDEAYSLVREDTKNDFGHEVIELLLKEMSDGEGDLAIVFAGYPNEMETFMNSNPGLKSRINIWFTFADYLPDELLRIAQFRANKNKLTIEKDALALIEKELVEAYRDRDRFFGNARFANSLVDGAKFNLGLRIMQSGKAEKLSKEQLSQIKKQDVEKILEEKKSRAAKLPVDNELLSEANQELRALVGLDTIKQDFNELIKLVNFFKETGKDVTRAFSLHSIFTGNPGTGKTTVARIMAKAFRALGLLERGHLVEVDRQSLVAGYIGQTAIKTAEKIDEAMGGVLFIDEAYALTGRGGDNDFGQEVVETLLKKMEDRRGEFAVIAAGYPDEMQWFLESNPGLKSRFDKVYKFPDFSADELIRIAILMLAKESMVADEHAINHLKAYFGYHFKHKDKFFGNARFVRKVIGEAVRNQNLRLAALPAEDRTGEMIQTLSYDDVKEFQLTKDILNAAQEMPMGFSIEPK